MVQSIPYRVATLTGRARARPWKGLMVLQVETKITAYHSCDRDQGRPLWSSLEWRDASWEDVAGSFEIGKGG